MSVTDVFGLINIITRVIGEGKDLEDRLDRLIQDSFLITRGERIFINNTLANVGLTLHTLNYILAWSYILKQSPFFTGAQVLVNMLSGLEQAIRSIHALINEIMYTVCLYCNDPARHAEVVKTWEIQKIRLVDIEDVLTSLSR